MTKTVKSTYRTASRRKAHQEKELEEAIAQLNERIAWIHKHSGIFRLEHKDFIRVADLKNALANQKFTQMVNGRLKSITLAEAWIDSPRRREHRDLTFRPGQPAVVDDCVNIWDGWGCEPKPGDITLFLQLLEQLFGEATQERDWFLKWLACPLQHPGCKLSVAVLLWSLRQGVGKSILGETIGRIYGNHFRTLTAGELHGRFNDWVKGALFVLGEENTSTDKRTDADRLKHLVTGDTVHYEGKFQPVVSLANMIILLLTSNHPDGLRLETYDRRFFVWEITGEPLPGAFYAEFVDWRDNRGGLSALMHYLLTLDLTGFDPKAHAPITDAKRDMIELSNTDLERYLRSDVIMDDDDTSGRNEIVDPFEVALRFSERSGNKTHGTAVCKALKKLGYDVKERVVLSDHTRPTLYARRRLAYWKGQDREAWRAEFERECRRPVPPIR